MPISAWDILSFCIGVSQHHLVQHSLCQTCVDFLYYTVGQINVKVYISLYFFNNSYYSFLFLRPSHVSQTKIPDELSNSLKKTSICDDDLGPLPENWEKAYTEDGEPYFIE